MSKRPLTRGEKWLYILVVPLIAFLIGTGAFINTINRPPDIQIPPPKPTPQPNGYDLYAAAANSIVRSTPAVDPVNDTQVNIPPAVQAERYSLKRREAWLAANQVGMALFQQALKTPCQVPIARSPAMSTHHARLRELARNKVAEINTYKLRGDWALASTTAIDVIQMAHSTSQGTLMDLLVGSAIAAVGTSTLEDVPDKLTGARALADARRLENLYPQQQLLVNAMTEEKWGNVSAVLAMLKESKWRSPDPSLKLPWMERLRMRTISKQNVVDEVIERCDIAIAEAAQPYSAVLPPRPQPSVYFISWLTPTDKARFVIAREQTRTSLLIHRYALRAYRVEHGRYPENLRALVPRYISRTYADPFGNGNEPLRYRRKGDSYQLWSLGTDCRDNNGVSVPKIKRPNQISITQEQKGDIIVGP